MTDITKLAQREKFEAWWEREYKHLESSKYTDAVPHIKYGFWMAYQAGGAELVEALASEKRICATWRKTAEANSEKLEKAQAKADVYDMLRDDYGLREKDVGLADFVDWQANRIAALEKAQQRNAELDSFRTVKLPLPSCTYADHSYPAYSKRQVISLLESLGITVVEGDV